MINANGWEKYSIWEHSGTVQALYRRRCLLEEDEMTCHAQAAELLAPHVSAGDTLLDAGCGSGYFFHSLSKRQIPAEYYGIDAASSLIAIGRSCLPAFGLPADRLQIIRIEDLDAEVDHVLCINVLSNMDNYHRPLERLLNAARKTLILRESCHDRTQYSYVRDRFLDEGWKLNVYVNTYGLREVMDFMASYGFVARHVIDRRTLGKPEPVIGHPHYWTFLVAERKIPKITSGVRS